MADVKWIKIATEVFDNRKIKQIERMPEGDAIIVVWFKLLCLAGTCNKNGLIFLTEEIPYTEEMLATEFNMEQPQRFNVLKLAMRTFQQFKMIEIIDDVFYIASWEKYQNTEGLEKIREQNRIRQARYKESQKQLPDNVISNVTDNAKVTHGNATDIDIDKEIDKDIKINKKKSEYEKKYSDGSFEMKCVSYLITSIKAEMPDAKVPETDSEIDKWCDHIEKMLRLDKRTEKDIYDTLVYARSDSFWKANIRSTSKFREKYETLYSQMKNKSNKQPEQHKTAQGNNKFNNFPQRSYTADQYADLERKLLNKGV